MSFNNIKAGIVTFYGAPKGYTKDSVSAENRNYQSAGKIRDMLSPFGNIVTPAETDSYSFTGR